ncbi:MAG: phosphotransferase [Gammaproteobacteria bacterium]
MATVTIHDSRLTALESWLSRELGAAPRLEPVSSDASFRRYFRLISPDSASLIAMDAPPEHEDTAQFLAVARLMRGADVHVPEVKAATPDAGFALLSDLGTQTYLDAINEGDADALITDALNALVRWQSATRPGALPPYDDIVLHRELALFPDWYVERHLGRRFTPDQRRVWERVCAALVSQAQAQPQVYVHRDFILRNLMVADPNPGVIDFQDALVGPIAYDVLTLFRDAFHRFDPDFIEQGIAHYLELARAAGLPVPTDDEFRRWFDLIGVQRHLKVAGIFARLAHRDSKPKYLAEIPRFLGYLRETAPHYPETEALIPLLDALEDGT